MGILRYVNLTFKRDFKNNIFYMLAMTFSVALIFNIWNVIFNPNIIEQGSSDYETMLFLGLIVQAVTTLFMLFANYYYIEGKMTEYGVIALAGKSIYEISVMILIRTLFSSSLAIFLGCIIGTIVSPLITGNLYSLFNYKGTSNYLSLIGLVMTIIILAVQLMVVLLINTSSIYTKKVTELMNQQSIPFIPDKRTIKVNPKIYFIVFLFPVVIFLLPITAQDKMQLLSIIIIFTSFGTQGIVRYFVPDLLYKYKTKILITNKIRIISISNLYHSIQKSTLLILTLIITTTLSISIACTYKSGSALNLFSLTCFMVIIGVMSLTIVYKFLVESFSRKKNYNQLKLLGYTKAEILKIITEEVVIYYGIILLITLTHMSLIILTSIFAGFLSATLGIKIIVGFILTLIVTGFISFFGYKKVAL